MALLRVFFWWVRSFSWRRSPLSRQWEKGLLSPRTSGRYSSPAASPVTFKAAKCMRSCRSINQKQLLSLEQSCSHASRTRRNDASSESSSRNSLRALTASERARHRQELEVVCSRPFARTHNKDCCRASRRRKPLHGAGGEFAFCVPACTERCASEFLSFESFMVCALSTPSTGSFQS